MGNKLFEADIVRDIFTRYKNGEKAKEIIARLNGQGIKTKAGSSFNMNSLARIIRNEKYIGKVTSHGTVYTNVIPPIVDEELFMNATSLWTSININRATARANSHIF